MKPRFTPPASPTTSLSRAAVPSSSPLPAKVLGGDATLRGRTGADLLTGVHFTAEPFGICSTQAAMA